MPRREDHGSFLVMKHLLSLVSLLVLVFFPGKATVFTGEMDGFKYGFDLDNTCSLLGVLDPQIENAVIPSSITYKGETYTVDQISGAFINCINLKSVEIPNTIHTFYSAFMGCASLSSVTLPESAQVIGNETFKGCMSLEEILIPNSVYEIGTNVFEDCINVKLIKIPQSVIRIGDMSFAGCENLEKIEISDLSNWCNFNLSTVWGENSTKRPTLFLNGSEIVDLEIPKDIEIIKAHTFEYFTQFKSLKIPETTKVIENNAFAYCTNLEGKIIIPDGVEKVRLSVFRGCEKIESISFSETVTAINNFACYDCSSLTEVFSYNPVPPIITIYTFSQNPPKTLYVPDESIDLYKNADYWKDFYEIKGIKDNGAVEEIMDNEDSYQVYDINGRRILNTKSDSFTQNLSSGVYIINGKKVLINK